MNYLRAPYDRLARALAGALVIAWLLGTGWCIGYVRGVHAERMKAWKECEQRHHEAARERGWVLAAMPCEGAR